MRKPGTDPTDVQMTDVLCDFCHREWTEDVPFIEGHHGACICGDCMTAAYAAVVLETKDSAPAGFTCTMCLETSADREALNRAGEPGWKSPGTSAAICRRCIKLGSGALHKDRDFDWRKPQSQD